MEIRTFEPGEYKDVRIYVRQYDKYDFEYLFFWCKQLYTYPFHIANTKIKGMVGAAFNEDELAKIKTMIEQEAIKNIDILDINKKIADKGNQQIHRNFIRRRMGA